MWQLLLLRSYPQHKNPHVQNTGRDLPEKTFITPLRPSRLRLVRMMFLLIYSLLAARPADSLCSFRERAATFLSLNQNFLHLIILLKYNSTRWYETYYCLSFSIFYLLVILMGSQKIQVKGKWLFQKRISWLCLTVMNSFISFYSCYVILLTNLAPTGPCQWDFFNQSSTGLCCFSFPSTYVYSLTIFLPLFSLSLLLSGELIGAKKQRELRGLVSEIWEEGRKGRKRWAGREIMTKGSGR